MLCETEHEILSPGIVHTETQHSAVYPLSGQFEGPHALMDWVVGRTWKNNTCYT
jgi:hypothetical protein